MPIEQEVRVYTRSDGSEPYSEWLRGLRDGSSRNRIRQRVARLRLGNLGDTRSVSEGSRSCGSISAPASASNFGREGDAVVILLCGGDKGSQDRDIERAQNYWRDYRSHPHE